MPGRCVRRLWTKLTSAEYGGNRSSNLTGGSAVNPGSGFVAILTLPGGMEEAQRIALQYWHCDCHDVPGPCKLGVCMSYLALRLQVPISQPIVDQSEPRAAAEESLQNPWIPAPGLPSPEM